MSSRIKPASELPRRATGNGKAASTRKQADSVHGRNGAEETPRRVAKLEPPAQPVSFGEWHDVIAENYPTLVKPAEVCLSVVAQLLLNDVTNPFALALVDAPSSGKTITLNFFDEPRLI